LTAFISPFIKDRQIVKELVNEEEFIEIFVDTPLSICESRDPKGLYKKARSGDILNFTGISSPYEIPIKADIKVQTDKFTIEESVIHIINYLKQGNYIDA